MVSPVGANSSRIFLKVIYMVLQQYQHVFQKLQWKPLTQIKL